MSSHMLYDMFVRRTVSKDKLYEIFSKGNINIRLVGEIFGKPEPGNYVIEKSNEEGLHYALMYLKDTDKFVMHGDIGKAWTSTAKKFFIDILRNYKDIMKKFFDEVGMELFLCYSEDWEKELKKTKYWELRNRYSKEKNEDILGDILKEYLTAMEKFDEPLLMFKKKYLNIVLEWGKRKGKFNEKYWELFDFEQIFIPFEDYYIYGPLWLL